MGPNSSDERVQELIDACLRGSYELVQSLFLSNDVPDVNGCDENENTPLQAAATSGNNKLVELLLDSGAEEDMDCCNAFGWTAVMHAAYHGHVNVLHTLVHRNANINKKTYYRISPLTLAARGGHTKVVEALLKWGAMIDPPAGEVTSFTPLIAATMTSQQEICQSLINLGANANACVVGPDVNVLMIASLMSHLPIVQILLAAGADSNALTCRGQSAMQLALAKRRHDIHTLLESKSASKNDHVGSNIGIFDAIKSRNHRRVRECLIEDPACANRVGEGGMSPLMLACTYGRMDFVTMLITHDAQLDAADAHGKTPLIHAIAHGKTGTAKYLIHAGANVDVKALDGTSALDMAAVGHLSDRELLQLLVKRTGKPEEREEARRRTTSPHNATCPICPKPIKILWKRLLQRARRIRPRTQATPVPRVTIAPDDHIFIDKSRQLLEPCSVSLFVRLEDIVGRQSGDVVPSSNHIASDLANSHGRAPNPRNVNLGSTTVSCPAKDCPIPLLDLSSLQTNRRGSTSTVPHLHAFKSFRSVAYCNAISMGPGRPHPPPLPCLVTSNAVSKYAKQGSSRDSSSMPVTDRCTDLSSSQSSAGGGSLNRRRRQYAMSNTAQLATGMTHVGVMRRRAATGGHSSFARPHSYHMDPAVTQGPAGVVRNGQWLGQWSNTLGRPHSYHDTDSGWGSRGTRPHLSARDAGSQSQLPVTPTRKSFAFNFSAANLHKQEGGDSGGSSLNASQMVFTNNSRNNKVNLAKADLRQVLKNLSLHEFSDILEQNEVDVETLVTLTESDLIEIGLKDAFARGKLMAGINIVANIPSSII